MLSIVADARLDAQLPELPSHDTWTDDVGIAQYIVTLDEVGDAHEDSRDGNFSSISGTRRPSVPAGPAQHQRGPPRTSTWEQTREDQLCARFQQELLEKETELRDALAVNDVIRREWKQATAELNKLQRERNYKLDDDTLVREWTQLRYELKNWALTHFNGDFKQKVLKSLPLKDIGRLVRDPEAYLRFPESRQLLAQALVWDGIQRKVFGINGPQNGLLWAGNDQNSFRALRTQLLPTTESTSNNVSEADLRDYHRWRALTSELIHRRVKPQVTEARVRAVADAILEVVSAFANPKGQSFRNDVNNIVRKASDMDADFHKQRAEYFVRWMRDQTTGLPYGFKYNPAHSESVNGYAAQNWEAEVHIGVAPALLKHGTADGGNYNETMVLVKSQVSLQPPDSLNTLPATQANARTLTESPRNSITSDTSIVLDGQDAPGKQDKRSRQGSTFSDFGKGMRRLISNG